MRGIEHRTKIQLSMGRAAGAVSLGNEFFIVVNEVCCPGMSVVISNVHNGMSLGELVFWQFQVTSSTGER